jgi:DNA invertase Pin-like site-specific DNA recombinase
METSAFAAGLLAYGPVFCFVRFECISLWLVASSRRQTRTYSRAIDRIHKREALIKVLDKPHLDLTSAINRGLIAFLSALAEDERQRILARCADGRKSARAKGVRFGRKTKLNEEQRQEARRRLEAGESARSIGKILGVHHATVLGAM